MSKRNRARRDSLLRPASALAAALLALFTGTQGLAQRQAPAAVNPKAAAVREATAEVLRETSELRKLRVLRPVRSGTQTRAEIERMLVRSFDENTTPEEMRASETAMKKFGLVPADFQLRPFIISLLTEQVAGYYDRKAQEFFLADWIDVEGQKPVIAHELTHALQDQHFNLRRFEKMPRHESDSELAVRALIEGDATVLMTQYVMRSPARQIAMLRSMMTGGGASAEQLNKAPRILRETLMFPYVQGSTWAAQVYKRGGWELVSRAYEDLPKSTEQVLHPEKYFARELPLPVAAGRSLAGALGKGWKQLDHDVNGEWGYLVILDEYLRSKGESERAAAGWHGDRYVLYAGPNPGQALITQKSYWDTEEDVREFFDAYARRTTLRYHSEPVEKTEDSIRWATAEGEVFMERSGSSVFIIEGVPETADSRALMRSLRRP